jgi:thioredoxin reductase
MTMPEQVDVAVVGGSVAGLQAALTLGRAMRSVAVIDDGHPRNAPARHVHNFLGLRQTSPAGFLAQARAQLAEYDVRLCDTRVGDAVIGDTIELSSDAGPRCRARVLLLATGLREELPAIPGVARLWGGDVVACPHCHGWEVRGESLALIGMPGEPARTLQRALLISRWTDRLTLFAADRDLDRGQRAALSAAGVAVSGETVERLESAGDRLGAMVLADGTRRAYRAVFVVTRQHQQTDLARRLGCEHDERGAPSEGIVRTDAEGRTSVPGVWAAGSTTVPAVLAIGAAGHGSTVAVAIHNALTTAELTASGPATP